VTDLYPEPVAESGDVGDRRLVLFDLDNTLIDRAAGFRAWSHRFVAERELDTSILDYLETIDEDGVKPREQFFTEIRERCRLTESVDQLAADFRAGFPELIPPLAPETQHALRELRREGWRIGIVTNGSPAQESRIEALGLDAFVDGWAVSGVVGVRKPDPALFAAAAKRCAAPLAGAWMVGDRADADVAGAIACGMSSVWISRGRTWTDRSFQPDIVAASVAEAVSAIRSRSS
jgi:HAD superfamily hydrolase (TIGR01662 family)